RGTGVLLMYMVMVEDMSMTSMVEV
ncbi:hypothetical protein LCGC14_1904540, partial [marine sediment metagenome]